MTQLKDTFSMEPKEIETTRNMLNGMVTDLSARFPNMKKTEPSKTQASSTTQLPPQTTQPVPAQSMPTPLNAANLHQRSNSRSSHTPAAPTSSQPPFQFGATSPHGAPSYIGKSTVTQDNLHIPARKKQKQTSGPGQSTPGSTSSPQVTKASPDVKRQQPESKPQVKSSLCCPDCERHNVGLDSEEALKLHREEEHIKPLSDPLKYSQENLASILGLDAQGQSKKPASSKPAASKMTASNSKQGQTPDIKGEGTPGGTPMNRQVSMNRQGSAVSGKYNPPPKSVPAKDARFQSGQKDSTKQQESQPQQETVTLDPWANTTIDPHELLQSFQPFETGAGGAISDLNVYRSITPNDTPESSKDGVSEPNSDISEGVGLDINLDIWDDSWMPFGPSETDGLYDMNNFDANREDMVMMDDDPSKINYQSWDDMVDPSAFDKQFSFDTSFYSMQAD